MLSGLQHVALMAVYLVFPALLAQASGSSPEVAASVVSMTLIALAIGTILQRWDKDFTIDEEGVPGQATC